MTKVEKENCTSHIFPRHFSIILFDCIFQCVVTQEKFDKVLVVAPLPGTWTLTDLFKLKHFSLYCLVNFINYIIIIVYVLARLNYIGQYRHYSPFEE